MSNHGCVNGKLDGDKYSAPMPIIGLYIAAGGLAFLVLMLYDVVVALLSRKRWLPCKLFSLNSITLTLLAVATKLPLDLTTSMPSTQDQLSKLSGTTLICITMGFFAPSVGVRSNSESVTNMAALSIFVVTIVVNISIQISTGVIVLFVPEHVIILSCMLLLLLMLWSASLAIDLKKMISIDEVKDFLTKGRGTTVERLKLCYLHTYNSNPQLVICKHPVTGSIGALCLVCLVVLAQAAVRVLILKQLKFCGGVSDYDWSIKPIVLIQTFIIMVGSLAIIFRWIAMFRYTGLNSMLNFGKESDSVINKNRILGMVSTPRMRWNLLAVKYMRSIVIVQVWIIYLPLLTLDYFGVLPMEPNTPEGLVSAFTSQICTEDMERMLMQVRKNDVFPNQLFQLLSRTSPSPRSPTPTLTYKHDLEASPLSIVLLVKIAQYYLPDKLSKSIVQGFVEVNEIVHFIYKTLSPKRRRKTKKSLFAKAVWIGDGFSWKGTPYEGTDDGLEHINRTFRLLRFYMPLDAVGDDLRAILNFIPETYSSVEDLCTCLEQMFVDMLHVLFTQLPSAIFQSLNESPVEEFEKRVRFALKLLHKIEKLEPQFEWSYPQGYGISRLITPEEPEEKYIYRKYLDYLEKKKVEEEKYPAVNSDGPGVSEDVRTKSIYSKYLDYLEKKKVEEEKYAVVSSDGPSVSEDVRTNVDYDDITILDIVPINGDNVIIPIVPTNNNNDVIVSVVNE